MKLEILLDLISDRQLQEYVDWLEIYPDSTEEDSLDFLMDILTDSQLDILLETDEFNSTPYSNWYGACIGADGSCFESTLEDCRLLGGRFQGHGTSCGGLQPPLLMHSEYNAPEGKVYRDPAAASDPRLKKDTPPKEVTKYLQQHPEVANMYDDDDASVMMKGIILGCIIGAVGTIFGNLASEVIIDKWKINPVFSWDKD